MLAAGIVDLFVRMLTSLAIVLAIVAVAYVVMRRRAGLTTAGGGRNGRRSGTGARVAASGSGVAPSRTAGRPARRGAHQRIEVLGRVGLSRSSAAVAVRFGDRVLLVGASEQSCPAVLAEIDAATWELCDADAEWTVPAAVPGPHGSGTGEPGAAARPSFLDALREATVRRA